MKKVFLSLLLSLSFILSACLLPERFICNINIKEDGTYSITYKGTVTNYFILESIGEGAQNEDDFKIMLDDLKTDSDFTQYQYIGNGRAEVSYQKTITDKSEFAFYGVAPFLTINPDRNGNIVITESSLGAGDYQELVSWGYKIQGTVNITSELPVKNNGGNTVQRQGNNYIIRQKLTSIPVQDIVMTFGNDSQLPSKRPCFEFCVSPKITL